MISSSFCYSFLLNFYFREEYDEEDLEFNEEVEEDNREGEEEECDESSEF